MIVVRDSNVWVSALEFGGTSGLSTVNPLRCKTAVAAKADLLVAGDRDLLSLKSFQGVGIVTPVDYLRISFLGLSKPKVMRQALDAWVSAPQS